MPLPKPEDSIVAIATPIAQGGVGIVRLSGWNLSSLIQSLIGQTPPPRYATKTTFRDEQGEVLDHGLAIYFPRPHSFTGEDVLELHGHGSVVGLRNILARCIRAGARPAEPGEFSLRAFLNGKMDLAQAEGMADYIEAVSDTAARSAQRSLAGDFSQAIGDIQHNLTEVRVHLEASLDFPEDVHMASLQEKIKDISKKITKILHKGKSGPLMREGVRLVIAGRPNVGKSSLMNHLMGEERAIVSSIPGTTRDVLRETLLLEGVVFHISDTAGIREQNKVDEVECQGIDRTHKEIATADIVLLVMEAPVGQTQEDDEILTQTLLKIASKNVVKIYNKSDLQQMSHRFSGNLYISAKTGEGIKELKQALLATIGWKQSEGIYLARERHLDLLNKAFGHVVKALQSRSVELQAEELRLAHQALGEITGEINNDELLGKIFSTFCLGK